MHDQFQDFDYWTGHVDLRHLLDLRDLATSPGGIDWQRLASRSKPAREKCAGDAARRASRMARGGRTGRDASSPDSKFQQWRRRVQSRVPALRTAFLPMMLLDFRSYRAEIGAEERATNQLKPKKWSFPKGSSIRCFYSLANKNPVGKI